LWLDAVQVGWIEACGVLGQIVFGGGCEEKAVLGVQGSVVEENRVVVRVTGEKESCAVLECIVFRDRVFARVIKVYAVVGVVDSGVGVYETV